MCQILEIKSTAIAVSGSTLQITIPTVTLTNNQHFRLYLCQSIPSTAGVMPVQIVSGSSVINVMLRTGNYMRADQLKCHKGLDLVYGNDPVHISMLHFVKPSCYSVAFPTDTTAATPTTVSVAQSKKV